jgi:hypothetical protein
MRWHDVIESLNAELRLSNPLFVALEDAWAIYKHSAPRTPRIPSIALMFITEGYRDSINDLELQVSIFARSVQQMIAIEQAVRNSIDRHVWTQFPGVYMRCQLISSVDLTEAEGIVHRALDFGISLPRQRYVGAEAS